MHLSTPSPYTTIGGAHGRYSKAPINLGPPNLALMVSVVAAGGGQPFDSEKFLAALIAGTPTAQSELTALSKKFGAEKLALFMKTFDFVVGDSLAQITRAGMTLPVAPALDPANAKALSGALLIAGTTPRGKFDVEYMLDTLGSHPIHVQVMNDVDANTDYGPPADANYHTILAQIFADLATAAKL